MADLATSSARPAGGAAVSALAVVRSRSARAANPAGLRSVMSWSWPAMPAAVAVTGSSAATCSTYWSAMSLITPIADTLAIRAEAGGAGAP